MKRRLKIFNQLGNLWKLLLLIAGTLFLSLVPEKKVVLENGYFRYVVGNDGKNLQFSDKKTGIDYLYRDSVSYFAYATDHGRSYRVTDVSIEKNTLKLAFKQLDLVVDIVVRKTSASIELEVKSLSKKIESLNFLNIPLRLNWKEREPFTACALSLNLYTRVKQLPAIQNHLWAACYQSFGLTGASVALIGVPSSQMLPAIRKVVGNAKGIPPSREGGAWAQLGKEGYGSYLMNFGTLTEQSVGDWIRSCASLGFNQIDSHGSFDNHAGNSFFRFGDFQLNNSKWPDGWDSFTRINKKLHDAGISSIFHTYAFFLDKNSKYVTPVPSPDLGYRQKFTIAASLSADATEITVNEPTEGLSAITGWAVQNSNTLRLDKELITFTRVSDKPPFTFLGCKRGAWGTTVSAHPKGEDLYHLKEMFGLFVPGAETNLFKEIAINTAEIVNKCHFDGIYLDAIDASQVMYGEESAWYFGTKFVYEIAKHLDHPVGMEMSTMFHHWWHYRSRWQAWDRPTRGYKRFVDIHLATIRGESFERNSSTLPSNYFQRNKELQNGKLLLPLHLGWWGNQTWDPPQTEPTFYDDVEYLCCKMLAYNAGLSMIGGADENAVKTQPGFVRLNELIRQYELLRHQKYFSDSILTLLKIPGKEYSLVKTSNNRWTFKPAAYLKHKTGGINPDSTNWEVNNEFQEQPAKFRIELLLSARPYEYKDNIIIADQAKWENVTLKEAARGVRTELRKSAEKTPAGEPTMLLFASSNGAVPAEGSWINLEKKFLPALNLEKNQGLGVWIKGNGEGQLLDFRLKHTDHLGVAGNGDHLIKVDFKGWKYFELVEIESSEFSKYTWSPADNQDFYRIFRNKVLFSNIAYLQLLCNTLQGKGDVSCLIGPIKALPLIPVSVKNPVLTINGQKIILPITMESGMYIERLSTESCNLYGPKGDLISVVQLHGPIPRLRPGKNSISFSCEGPSNLMPRAQVTLICEGVPLQ